jgi:serine/threonine protein kinase
MGLVHGDLKLNNILIEKDCKIKIIDFGISRFVNNSISKDSLGYVNY